MIYCVEVSIKPGLRDARGESVRRQIEALGIGAVQSVSTADLYFLQGNLDGDQIGALIDTLLHDPVVEQARWHRIETLERESLPPDAWSVEVTLLPGVTDSVAESLLAGARLIGVTQLEQAATGQRYVLRGALVEATVERIAGSLLANGVIQSYHVNALAAPPFVRLAKQAIPEQIAAAVDVIAITVADPAGLLAISRERRLSLDLAEMQAIQAYYRREGREPTDVELETLAQTWSEHCVHKTFRAVIEYTELGEDITTNSGTGNRGAGEGVGGSDEVRTVRIDGLLKTYIRAATEKVNKPWVRSAFVDNAGIVQFDDQYDLAFKVETHNHPSALEPFGGANTGVGGVVRDVIGVSARPIANTDVLCFGPQDLAFEALPAGVLHPRRIASGVIAGIEDYGNKMGIPTVNGAFLYDPGYTANPLVFCGCLGILPHGSHPTTPEAGDLAVVLGGRTGRDGLRGATFSSMEMDHQTGDIAGSAVQIGHPIHEKQVLEAVLLARDEQLYTAITDCGAGGLSSAVGEMGKDLGATVHLERVPLKYPGLQPWEIWLSEAQERMVLAVPPDNWPRLQALCADLDVEATALGTFTGDGRLRIYYGEQLVGNLDAEFLHDGIPRRYLKAEWGLNSGEWRVESGEWAEGGGQALKTEECGSVLTNALLALLAMPETRSKEDVVRQYDHEVQGGTVVKPFVGFANSGPGDATVLTPLDALRRTTFHNRDTKAGPSTSRHFPTNLPLSQSTTPTRGVALSVGANPFYTAIDPYLMAWAAVDEAMRNVVAVGGDPDQVSLLDNFSWGNPNLPDRLGGLVRCTQGCYDAAVAYGAPFISGKDSLNNEYTGEDGKKHAIPGTLVISALAMVPDVRRTVTMDLKAAGNLLYLVGLTRGEMGGSSYMRMMRSAGGSLPPVGRGLGRGSAPQPPDAPLALYRRLHQAMANGLVLACHDCSEGGLAVAAAEMALAGGLGFNLRLADVPRLAEVGDEIGIAFCESLGRLLFEVAPEHADAFETALAGLPVAAIGEVRDDDRIQIIGLAGMPVVETIVAAVTHAWRGHLTS